MIVIGAVAAARAGVLSVTAGSVGEGVDKVEEVPT